MKKIAFINLIYGSAILAGGLVAGLRKGSTVSIVMSLVSFLLLALFGYLCYRGRVSGCYGSLAVAFLLDGMFTFRFAHSQLFFPSGFFTLLSLAYLCVVVLVLRRQDKKASSN